MKRIFRLLVTVLLLFLLPVGDCLARPTPQEPIWEITSPLANAQLIGMVQIMGSAFLGGDFGFYTLEYAPANAPQAWVVFDGSETQVRDGLLGVWNTTSVPDGLYNLRLKVVKKDGNFKETPARQVVVANLQLTPTPTPTETPTPSPVILASPTVMVVQPTSVYPTATPMPLATRTSGAGLPESISLPGILDLARSFIFGALVAGVVFALVMLVALLRRFT